MKAGESRADDPFDSREKCRGELGDRGREDKLARGFGVDDALPHHW